jgi:hypothetical protein
MRMTDRPATDDTTAPERERLPSVPVHPSVDDMGEWSFPASDPPATWTWDVEQQSATRERSRDRGVGM